MLTNKTYQINNGMDDGMVRLSSIYGQTLTSLMTQQIGPTAADIFLRFNLIDIPQHTTIVSAYVIMHTVNDSTGDNSAVPQVLIKVRDIGNATAIVDTASLSSITYLPSEIPWNMGSSVRNTDYQSPDFSQLIQSVVNRVDWDSGNSIFVYLRTPEIAYKSMYSYEGSTTYAPKLVITYYHEVDDIAITNVENHAHISWTNPVNPNFNHCNIYLNESTLVASIPSPSNSYDHVSAILEQGQTFKVTTVDNNNNESIGVYVTYDVVAPVLTSSSSLIVGGVNITFSADELIDKIVLFYRISGNQDWTSVALGYVDDYILSGLPVDTNYEYYFTAEDSVGNTSASSIYTFRTPSKIYDTPRGSAGMTLLGSNNDDTTVLLPNIGFDFYYNGVNCRTSMYISGNSWIGIGSATEIIKIDRRDAKYQNAYYSSEVIGDLKAFRIRYEGSRYYSSVSSDLWWELILFEDSTIELISERMPSTIDGINSFDTVGFGIYTQSGGWTANKSYVFSASQPLGKSYTVNEGFYPIIPNTPTVTINISSIEWSKNVLATGESTLLQISLNET